MASAQPGATECDRERTTCIRNEKYLNKEQREILTAGFDQTMCVAEDGSVFAFGRNDSGRLGLGDAEYRRRLGPALLRGKLRINWSCKSQLVAMVGTLCS